MRRVTTEELARKLFDAYNATPPHPGLNYAGMPVPPWGDCGHQVQVKWIGAASEAIKLLGGPR